MLFKRRCDPLENSCYASTRVVFTKRGRYGRPISPGTIHVRASRGSAPVYLTARCRVRAASCLLLTPRGLAETFPPPHRVWHHTRWVLLRRPIFSEPKAITPD